MPGQEFSADELVVGKTYRVQYYKRHDDRPAELMSEGNYELTNMGDLLFHFKRKKYDPNNPHLRVTDIPRRTDPHNPEHTFYWRFFETSEDIENRGFMRAALNQRANLPSLESKLLSEKYFGGDPPRPPGGGRKYTHRRTKIRRKNKTKTKKSKRKTRKTHIK
jgi:hypothetical protein